MILKQGHKYRAMPHDGKMIRRIYRGGRCYYIASPYSPEATQALKAAFPQYWTAIHDYGWANPALVPFINEDPMLIVSLVEVGKERWLVGDGKAYIDTGVIYSEGFRGLNTTKFQFTNTNTDYQLFGINAGLAFGVRYNKFEDGMATSNLPCEANRAYILDQLFDSVECQNSIYGVGTLVRPTKSMLSYAQGEGYVLFATRSQGSILYPCSMKVSYIKMESSGVNVRHFVPCQHQGQSGMLDIVSLTFYPNANTEGTFTIQVTDKA